MDSTYFNSRVTLQILDLVPRDVEDVLNAKTNQGYTNILTPYRRRYAEVMRDEVWINSGSYSSSKVKALAFMIFCGGFLAAGIYFSHSLFKHNFTKLGIGLTVVVGITYTTITLQNTGGMPKSGKECSGILFAWLIGPFYPLYKNSQIGAIQQRKIQFQHDTDELGRELLKLFKANQDFEELLSNEEYRADIIEARTFLDRYEEPHIVEH
jgi:hypothetical protein